MCVTEHSYVFFIETKTLESCSHTTITSLVACKNPGKSGKIHGSANVEYPQLSFGEKN